MVVYFIKFFIFFVFFVFFFFSSRRRHTRWPRDWSSDVCSSDLCSPSRSRRTCTWCTCVSPQSRDSADRCRRQPEGGWRHLGPSPTFLYFRVRPSGPAAIAPGSFTGASMTAQFHSPLSRELQGFLRFKRSLGYRYAQSEFTLREFDRFLKKYARKHRSWRLDQAILAWLASKPQRKAISVSVDATIVRQFCRYLHRLPAHSSLSEPRWPQLPGKSDFLPYILSKKEVHQLLKLTKKLEPARLRQGGMGG